MGLGEWLRSRREAFWKRHAAGYVNYLQQKALEDFAQGKVKRARFDVTQVHQVSQEWLGQENFQALEFMLKRIVDRFAAGDLAQARELGLRWLDVVTGREGVASAAWLRETADRLRRTGSQEPALLWVLLCLGQMARDSDRLTEAEEYLREAIAHLQRVFGETGQFYIGLLDSLADLLSTNGKEREAAELCERALELARNDTSEPMDPLQEAYRRIVLSFLYAGALGDSARAQEMLTRAELLLQEAAERESLPSSPADRWNRLSQLIGKVQASGFDMLRETAAGITPGRLDRLASRAEKLGSSISPLETLECLYFLAQETLQASLGKDPLSLIPDSALDEAGWSWMDSLPDSSEDDTAETGQAAELLGLLDPVRQTYNQVLQDLVEKPDFLAPGAAESLLRSALEKRILALGESHPETAFARYKLAQYLHRQGVHGQGANEEFESLLQKAVADWRASLEDNHPYRILGLRALAGLYSSTGREREAWRLLAEIATVEDRLIANIFSFTSENQRTEFITSLEDTYVRSLSLIGRIANAAPEITREVFGLVLRRKGLVGRSQTAQWESALAQHHPQIEELGDLKQKMTDRLLAGETGDLSALKEQQERLEAQLARAISTSTWVREGGPVELEAFSQALPANSVLCEIVIVETMVSGIFKLDRGWTGHRYTAFVLPAGNLDGLRAVDLGEAVIVDTAIHELRTAVTGRQEARDVNRPLPARFRATDSRVLQEKLVTPLLEITDGRKRLLISPDGELSLLPFEILPDGKGGCLIDRFDISYLASGRDALRFGAPLSGEPRPPIVVAEPDYNLGLEASGIAAGALVFSPLTHAPAEGRKIAELLGVEPWTGAAAVESRLRQVHSPHLLHLATHGFLFDSDARRPERIRQLKIIDPLLQSGLALSGANTWLLGGHPPQEAGDGLLMAAEVSTLDLVNTELVVLSACKTGLGTIQAGEGVQGLRRSFALAGARTLIMSLWQVPDQETRELMEAFYGYLLARRGRAEALQQAQLELKTRNSNPFVWGAFVCQGDPGPLLLLPTERP